MTKRQSDTERCPYVSYELWIAAYLSSSAVHCTCYVLVVYAKIIVFGITTSVQQ